MTGVEDVLVCLGGAGAEFADPAKRPRINLSRGELAAFLGASQAASITLCAPWPELTVRVLRELAEWAADQPDRGCGVLPDGCVGNPAGAEITSSSALLVNGTDSCVLTAGGIQKLTRESTLDLLCSAAPPAALAITGHGGEHCIYMGNDLLATYGQVSLAGTPLALENIRCRTVFLNTCGSLRLGDSVVPRVYSLAARLHQRGIAVIGAYRNHFTEPDIDLQFAREAIAGVPLGRVVNHLNRESRRLGDPAHSYQLLGDATLTVSDLCATRASRLNRGRSQAFPAKLIRELTWLDRLFATVRSWTEISTEAAERRQVFSRNLRLILAASHRNARYQLTRQQMESLVGAAGQMAREQRDTMLEELTSYTLHGIWPQSLCAPVASRPSVHRIVCPRCGGKAVRCEFAALEKGLLGLSSEDCDRCGTVADSVGATPESALVESECRGGEIRVRVPPLTAECSGRITVHRSRSVSPQIWPSAGGEVSIPVAAIPFRGKTTVAASRIGPDFLAWDYVTIFVPPS